MPDHTLALSPRAAATRQRILDAALAEFAAKGLAGARVDEIAARAGANKRMLYAHFGNKEDLWLTVLERAYAAKRAEERALRVDALPPVEAMRRTCRVQPALHGGAPGIRGPAQPGEHPPAPST